MIFSTKRQTECKEWFHMSLLHTHKGIQPFRLTRGHRSRKPRLFCVRTISEFFFVNDEGTNIGNTSTIGTVNIYHEFVAWLIVTRLECDGTAHDIRICLNKFPTVSIHGVGIVEMGQQAEIHIASRLFDTQQYIVNVRHCTFQRLYGLMEGLFPHSLFGIMKHDRHRNHKQNSHGEDDHQTDANRQCSTDKFRHSKHIRTQKYKKKSITVWIIG